MKTTAKVEASSGGHLQLAHVDGQEINDFAFGSLVIRNAKGGNFNAGDTVILSIGDTDGQEAEPVAPLDVDALKTEITNGVMCGVNEGIAQFNKSLAEGIAAITSLLPKPAEGPDPNGKAK